MVATKNRKATLRDELNERLPVRSDRRREFVSRMKKLCNISAQAIYGWFEDSSPSEQNLRHVADFFKADYDTLLLKGKIAPRPNRARRHADAVREVAAGYNAAALPTATEMTERWRALPPPVQAFLIHQIVAYEEIVMASPELARIMFKPPANPDYPEYEENLEKWQQEHQASRAKK